MKRPVRLPMASVTEELDAAMRSIARAKGLSISEAIYEACRVWAQYNYDPRTSAAGESALIHSSRPSLVRSTGTQ